MSTKRVMHSAAAPVKVEFCSSVPQKRNELSTVQGMDGRGRTNADGARIETCTILTPHRRQMRPLFVAARRSVANYHVERRGKGVEASRACSTDSHVKNPPQKGKLPRPVHSGLPDPNILQVLLCPLSLSYMNSQMGYIKK